MNNLTQAELAAIRAARDRQYSRDWFAELIGGRLGPGETFWMGWLGVVLIAIPSLLLGYLLLGGLNRTVATLFAVAVLAGLALYRLVLLRALWRSLRRQPRVCGWGWAGLVLTALDVLGLALASLALWLLLRG